MKTQVLSEKLSDLIQALDAMAPSPSLVDLAQALKSAELTIDNVASFVQTNPRNYHRALVVLREHYELLIMTWLPGQASVPHDHSGSICVMQVLQGKAVEESFCVASDGYADPDYETHYACGEISALQDASIHTVRNPTKSAETLVTVHIYAPPLRDFRRFVLRPSTSQHENEILQTELPTFVVVGGGFSGSMAAAQLLRRAAVAGVKMHVVIVERRGAVGEGVAYGTQDIAHLLNVPAARMSAWPDRPNDFVEWATARYGNVPSDGFLPRKWYGEYVRETLLSTAREANNFARLTVLYDEVRRIAHRPDHGWLVHLARGQSVRANAVLLAIGHRPPDDPIGCRWTGPKTRFIADPWRPFATNAIRPDESVVLLGSGLTAVDTVMSLTHSRRTSPVTIVSRRGLLPQAHAHSPLTPVDLRKLVSDVMNNRNGVRALELFRRLREFARESMAAGSDWRSVIDGVRPHTAALWQAMSMVERKRFLRHLRPFWEVHRHRMALAVAGHFGAMYDCEQVSVVAGRVLSASSDGSSVQLEIGSRRGRSEQLRADWVINCTGPAPSNCAASNPAIGSLLVDGWLRPDELGLGIETTIDGNLVDCHGHEVPDLFLIGTLRKPAVWESTAVPELRNQAAVAADRAIKLVDGQKYEPDTVVLRNLGNDNERQVSWFGAGNSHSAGSSSI